MPKKKISLNILKHNLKVKNSNTKGKNGWYLNCSDNKVADFLSRFPKWHFEQNESVNLDWITSITDLPTFQNFFVQFIKEFFFPGSNSRLNRKQH